MTQDKLLSMVRDIYRIGYLQALRDASKASSHLAAEIPAPPETLMSMLSLYCGTTKEPK